MTCYVLFAIVTLESSISHPQLSKTYFKITTQEVLSFLLATTTSETKGEAPNERGFTTMDKRRID